MEATVFEALNNNEMELVNAGGWGEFGQALIGTMLIAGAPIIAATGNVPGALVSAGTGMGLIGNL